MIAATSSKELLERRAKLVTDMRGMVALVSEEDRSFTNEEQEKFDKLDKDQGDLLNRANSSNRVESLFDDLEDPVVDNVPDEMANVRHSPKPSSDSPPLPDRDKGLRGWLLRDNATDEDREEAQKCGFRGSTLDLKIDRGTDKFGRRNKPPRTVQEIEDVYTRKLEGRAQSVGTATAGGHTVPDEMMRAIDIALKAFGGVRNVSTVIPTATGAALPIPTTNDTTQTGELLAENTAVNAQDVTFGQLVLDAYKYSSKLVLVSMELLQDAAVDVPSLLGRLLGERLGRILNTHLTTGTGTAQPNGIVTAATDSAITTASAAAITYNNLIDTEHTVDPAYRGIGSGWMFNDTTFAIIKQIADSQNRPLWMPSLVEGAPDRFDGRPITVNQDMASGSSAKSVLFGQLDKYLVREVLGMTLIRLDERYADVGQVGFLAWARWDGDLLDAGTNPVKYMNQGL